MERTTVRELHQHEYAAQERCGGETYVVELRGRPIAELRPISEAARGGNPLPDRDGFIRKLPRTDDIGAGTWFMIPVSDRIMQQVESSTRRLPKHIAVRACDEIHIVSANSRRISRAMDQRSTSFSCRPSLWD